MIMEHFAFAAAIIGVAFAIAWVLVTFIKETCK